MCSPTCAPVIAQSLTEWIALGGQNWGCVGNQAHTYGFHKAGCEIGPDDYSRSHDPGLPYDMDWACAGDFAHMGNAALRVRHANALNRLLANDPDLHMVDEFIGQPWADRPVYYWARWNGTGTLKVYTGAGHDTWSHISWRRSKANLYANLWEDNVAFFDDPNAKKLAYRVDAEAAMTDKLRDGSGDDHLMVQAIRTIRTDVTELKNRPAVTVNAAEVAAALAANPAFVDGVAQGVAARIGTPPTPQQIATAVVAEIAS